MKVVIHPDVVDYLIELSEILYKQEYFGFEDSAVEYTNDLFEAIREELPKQSPKKASDYFNKFGECLHYCMIKKNKRTQWYAFFSIYENKDELIYLVRYMSNNHMIAQYL